MYGMLTLPLKELIRRMSELASKLVTDVEREIFVKSELSRGVV